jgi:isocitrate dehydrogenase
VFEATHGTAPKYANLDKINPGSLILSGALMFDEIGWTDVSQSIVKGLEGAIATKRVTYDLARQTEGATEVSTSAFGDNIIEHLP